MRVVVTGGTGLIGNNAVKALLDGGHDVLVLTRSVVRPANEKGCRFARCNILEPSLDFSDLFSSHKASTLLHLAWETQHGKFWTAPSNSDWLDASLRMIRAFYEAGGKRVVAAGTCVEYDAPDEGPCIAGQSAVSPTHPYSVAKHTLHTELRDLAEHFEGSYAWARIFMVMGPGEPEGKLVPATINALLEGKPAKCSSGKQVRDFLHAQDYGAALASVAAHEFCGELNIASGKPVTIADVVTRIGALMNRPELIELGALPDRPGEPENLWGDIQTLREEIGFNPLYGLDEALEQIIDWHRQEKT